MKISIGDRFFFAGAEYIFAQVEAYRVAFIGLHDGNRYMDPVTLNKKDFNGLVKNSYLPDEIFQKIVTT